MGGPPTAGAAWVSQLLSFATEKGGTGVLVWNWQQPRQELSNRPFFTKVLLAKESTPAELRITGLAAGN